MIFGEMGSTMGRAIDELGSTQFDRRLSFIAEPGHDYQARVVQAALGYDYSDQRPHHGPHRRG